MIIIILISLLIIIFPVNIYLSNNWVKINKYVLKLDKLPSEFNDYTIVQMTDNHIKSTKDVELDKKFISKAEKKLKAQGKEIDCIVFTGDLIDEVQKPIPTGTLEMLAQLAEKYPVYLVQGNHDDREFIKERYADSGINVLKNESAKLQRGSASLWITGITDSLNNVDNEEGVFSNIPINDFNLVLVHAPNKFKILANYRADLILCGHTHAGQFRLPFFSVLYAPNQGIFPHYGRGFYEEKRPGKGASVMYVNSGIGYTRPIKCRFFNRPEIAVFTLEKNNLSYRED